MRTVLISLVLVFSPCAAAAQSNALPEFADIRPIAGDPIWLAAPSHDEIKRLHPRRAAERRQGGRVDLMCRVRAEGLLGCAIVSEAPIGWGFGEAALRVSDLYRIAPAVDGQPTAGRSVPLTVDFSDLPEFPQTCDDCGLGWPLINIVTRRNPHPAGVSEKD